MKSEKQIERSTLIPKWIKVFGWIFIVLGCAVPVVYLMALIIDIPASFMMFGFSYEGTPFALMPAFISALIVCNGLSAFGLIFCKDWGLNVCLLYGYFGLCMVILSMVLSPGSIALEPLLQIPYLYKLHKLRSKW
jgi:hypothetical protein